MPEANADRIEIRMPQVSSDVEEADLLAWLVAPGDRVEAGDVILEIETDKSTVELEAPASGVLEEILIPAGRQGVKVDELLGWLRASASATASPTPSATPRDPAAVGPSPEPEPEPEPAASRVAGTPATTALARRLAERAGLDLAHLAGSGAHGRILKQDIERELAGETGGTAASAAEPDPASTAETGTSSATPSLERESGDVAIAHSRMRRTIAERLSQAKRTIPHFYLSAACDVEALLEARTRIQAESASTRLSVNDFILRAAALALREVPEANASWSEEAIVQHGRVDIAVAVATDAGLLTPIVRDADRKGLAALSHEVRDLAERARAGRLSPNEYQGGGFSISNLGMYGIDVVYPIVNPPHAAILGVGQAQREPVVRGEQVAIGQRMQITLAADHRVIDGATGARLLGAIKRRLEDPLEMLL